MKWFVNCFFFPTLSCQFIKKKWADISCMLIFLQSSVKTRIYLLWNFSAESIAVVLLSYQFLKSVRKEREHSVSSSALLGNKIMKLLALVWHDLCDQQVCGPLCTVYTPACSNKTDNPPLKKGKSPVFVP